MKARRLSYLDEVREFFNGDRFATEAAGMEIVDARPDYAKVRMAVQPRHMNAAGYVMGGAIFTMADFAFAIASNMGQKPTVSLSSSIEYVSSTRGPVLFAETECVKQGRAVCFFRINITDGSDRVVAVVETSGYRPNS